MRGHAHVVEVQAAVVDAVEAALEPVVLAADAREEVAVLVAQRHVEAVHAVVDAVRDELREHRRRDAVQRRVAEVVLPGAAERRVDDELLGLGVVGRGRADRGDIRAVAGLGHRERAGDLEAHDAGEPLVVVLLRAQLQHGRAEQPPLHAGLDLQAGVGRDQLREAGDVGAVVAPRRRTPSGTRGARRRCSTSRCIWLSTRSRCSAMLRPSTRQNAGSLIISRASRRVSAHVPSSRSVTSSTSMRASDASAAVCGAVGAPPAGVRLLVAGFLERTAASAIASPFGGRRSH